MLSCVVDSVDSDGVESELLKILNISLAAIYICDGVGNVGGATRLVIDTSNVESVAAGKESYCGLVLLSLKRVL